MSKNTTVSPEFIEGVCKNLIDMATAGGRATQLARAKGRTPHYQPRKGDWVKGRGFVGQVTGRDDKIPGYVLVEMYTATGAPSGEMSMHPSWLTFTGREMPDEIVDALAGLHDAMIAEREREDYEAALREEWDGAA